MTDPVPIVLYGVGGLGREVFQIVLDIGPETWNVVGWLDDDPKFEGSEVHGLPVLGTASWLQDHPEVFVTVAVGYSSSRWSVVQKIRALGHERFATIIHPTAYTGGQVEVGAGSILAQRSTVTTDAIIGEHTLLNVGCVIGHDCVLSPFVSVAPNTVIGGGSHLHAGAEFGMNAGVKPNSIVGEWATVGAGAFVARDLPANTLAVGVPAKVIRERPSGWHVE